MLKLGLVLLGFIIFILLFTIGNASDNGGDFSQILLPALAAIFVMVGTIGIAPWLYEKSR